MEWNSSTAHGAFVSSQRSLRRAVARQGLTFQRSRLWSAYHRVPSSLSCAEQPQRVRDLPSSIQVFFCCCNLLIVTRTSILSCRQRAGAVISCSLLYKPSLVVGVMAMAIGYQALLQMSLLSLARSNTSHESDSDTIKHVSSLTVQVPPRWRQRERWTPTSSIPSSMENSWRRDASLLHPLSTS